LNLDPIYIDDNYVLTVSIYDLAGNVTEKKGGEGTVRTFEGGAGRFTV